MDRWHILPIGRHSPWWVRAGSVSNAFRHGNPKEAAENSISGVPSQIIAQLAAHVRVAGIGAIGAEDMYVAEAQRGGQERGAGWGRWCS